VLDELVYSRTDESRIKGAESRKSALPVGKSLNQMPRGYRELLVRIELTEIDQKQGSLRAHGEEAAQDRTPSHCRSQHLTFRRIKKDVSEDGISILS
jgi:hypothetical protein